VLACVALVRNGTVALSDYIARRYRTTIDFAIVRYELHVGTWRLEFVVFTGRPVRSPENFVFTIRFVVLPHDTTKAEPDADLLKVFA
jgi:hypothetical protein